MWRRPRQRQSHPGILLNQFSILTAEKSSTPLPYGIKVFSSAIRTFPTPDFCPFHLSLAGELYIVVMIALVERRCIAPVLAFELWA
jgi:hypothetical protein